MRSRKKTHCHAWWSSLVYIQDGVCNPPMIISRLGLLKLLTEFGPSVAWDNPHSPLWTCSSLSLLVAIIKHRMVDSTSRKKMLVIGEHHPVTTRCRITSQKSTESGDQIFHPNHRKQPWISFVLSWLEGPFPSRWSDEVPFRGEKRHHWWRSSAWHLELVKLVQKTPSADLRQRRWRRMTHLLRNV